MFPEKIKKAIFTDFFFGIIPYISITHQLIEMSEFDKYSCKIYNQYHKD